MRVFLGGRVLRGEFHEVERDVRAVCDRAKHEVAIRERINVDEASGRFTDESLDSQEPSLRSLYDFDFFVLCRSFPNEFTVKDVEAIRRVNPLAPIALIAGELCEGEARTGETFNGVRRYYLGSWRASGKREFARFFTPSSPEGLFAASPLATTEDYITGLAPRADIDRSENKGRVAIFADDPYMARLLKETFQEGGYEPIVRSFARSELELDTDAETPKDAVRIVVDSVDLGKPELSWRLSAIKSRFPGTPIDLLAFAPRHNERSYYERRDIWGKLRVVAKPFNVDDLLNAGAD